MIDLIITDEKDGYTNTLKIQQVAQAEDTPDINKKISVIEVARTYNKKEDKDNDENTWFYITKPQAAAVISFLKQQFKIK